MFLMSEISCRILQFEYRNNNKHNNNKTLGNEGFVGFATSNMKYEQEILHKNPISTWSYRNRKLSQIRKKTIHLALY